MEAAEYQHTPFPVDELSFQSLFLDICRIIKLIEFTVWQSVSVSGWYNNTLREQN